MKDKETPKPKLGVVKGLSVDGSNVVDILDKQRHVTGVARCIVCRHEWQCLAMVGSFWLECPECGCWRGVMKHHTRLPDGTMRLMCVKCGSCAFHILNEGAFCMGCNEDIPWEDIK